MCLAVFHKPGADRLLSDEIEAAWESNPDGAGYAFIDSRTGRLKIRKPFFNRLQFEKQYFKDHARHIDAGPMLVHFRLSTHGGENKHCTHPHFLKMRRRQPPVAMMHNGILPMNPPAGESDTTFFARSVLHNRLASELVTRPQWLEGIIGKRNKLAFLAEDGRWSIVNDSLGCWAGDTWFSNWSAWNVPNLAPLCPVPDDVEVEEIECDYPHDDGALAWLAQFYQGKD